MLSSAGAAPLDLVLCQNVLEHIADDVSAVAAMGAALAPGGQLALLVPAGPRLYGSLDVAYGHHRRYTRERLATVIAAAGLELDRISRFNALGVPGWWLKNRLGSTGVDRLSVRAYDALVAAWRPLERRIAPRAGLSLIAHAHAQH